MARLILLNGAPGSGKSTLAELLAQDRPLMLPIDVDGIKHSLGSWSEDTWASGLHARRLTVALAREQLGAGHDVVVGQYLARTEFIEALENRSRWIVRGREHFMDTHLCAVLHHEVSKCPPGIDANQHVNPRSCPATQSLPALPAQRTGWRRDGESARWSPSHRPRYLG
jgi:hypothetical protein